MRSSYAFGNLRRSQGGLSEANVPRTTKHPRYEDVLQNLFCKHGAPSAVSAAIIVVERNATHAS
ncbi:hypothetical protein HZB01_00815 [Candidatus Woesearchaeota archaeon]|nr:hypothetical protein [Candidatus Woesearchaeota archaeon]